MIFVFDYLYTVIGKKSLKAFPIGFGLAAEQETKVFYCYPGSHKNIVSSSFSDVFLYILSILTHSLGRVTIYEYLPVTKSFRCSMVLYLMILLYYKPTI